MTLNSLDQKQVHDLNLMGLSPSEITDSRNSYGKNIIEKVKRNYLLELLYDLGREPMVILLVIISSIYFAIGNYDEGIFLFLAILVIASISIFQENRSENALAKLKKLSQPHCKVIRDWKTESILSEDVVVGDLLIIEEGSSIVADGKILHSNDFSVNESILTGESFAVFKDKHPSDSTDNNLVYHGTLVNTGLAIIEVKSIGIKTRLAQLGKIVDEMSTVTSPLDIQIRSLVITMIKIGIVAFVSVWLLNYYRTSDVLISLIFALTIAMSILPEEIPVALATFMAMGSRRLMSAGIISKSRSTIETLGSATIICSDKTGTITKNQMSLVSTYDFMNNVLTDENDHTANAELLAISMWASEPIPFDPMEIALHEAYQKVYNQPADVNFEFIHEYPLSGKPPMMTHIFEDNIGSRIIAAKGAPEGIIDVSHLTIDQKEKIRTQMDAYTSLGYRVLGVANSTYKEKILPKRQQELPFVFRGLVAFYDPPKDNIEGTFNELNKAGVEIKIITGDNSETTKSIAEQISFKNRDSAISGEELMSLSDDELKLVVKKISIFSRMFPEAKLRIINAMKANGDIVAMIGDGVNDGPALKSANIGIAMGQKGSEVAKEAADLILIDDDLSKLVKAVSLGRSIHENLKKAVGYIISIHIPIILTVFTPLALNWVYPHIFTPVHVIILELIMGPTCSIVFENEPEQGNLMHESPLPIQQALFGKSELFMTIILGLFITLGTLTTYQFAIHNGADERVTRAMVFSSLISSNIVLTLVVRSSYLSFIETLFYKNNLVPLILSISAIILLALLYIPLLRDFFLFGKLSAAHFFISVGIGALSVLWYEVYKWHRRRKVKLLNS